MKNFQNVSIIKSRILELYFKVFANKQIDENNDSQLEQKERVLNLEEDSKQKAIQFFLFEVQSYLDNCFDNQVVNELLVTISSCFSFYPNYSLPFFDSFLNKYRFNENYIIIISSILYELTHRNHKIDISNFKFFINDSLTEIQHQIQNIENEKLILFGHQISPQFTNTLILNLLLSSNLTRDIIINFFPYVLLHNLYLRNPKFDSLLQDSLNSGVIFIPDQIEDINHDLIDIITNEEINFNINMNEKTLLFIICAVYFVRKESQNEIKINGFTSEIILPFLAISNIYIQKYEANIETTEKITELILNCVKLLNNDSSPLFKISLKLLLISKFFSNETNLNIIITLAQKLITNEFNDNNGEIILSYLFDFSTKMSDSVLLLDFFNTNAKNIFEIIFNRFDEFNDLHLHKLNLNIFNKMEILSHIDYFAEKYGFKQTIYFLENYCYNAPNIISFNHFLMNIIHEKIQENNWNDVLLIAKFIKKNDSSINFKDLSKTFNANLFPSSVKYLLFNNEINSNENIDDILLFILNDPFPEKNKQLFQILFEKMIENKEILQTYLKYLLCIRSNDFNLVSEFLKKFSNEFESYQDIFMDVVNEYFVFNKSINALYKNSFSGLNSFSINLEFGNSIISKLLKSIETKQGNFQAFLCLKNIANSFPFLFIQNIQKVFDAILSSLKYFYLVFDETKINEQLILIKTSISSFSFLITLLQSSLICDKFLNWLFTNIRNFTNSQVFVFILLLLICFKYNDISLIILVYVLKYDFIETTKILLERDLPKDYFKSQYINTICQLIAEIYKMMNKLTKYEIIQLEELKKIENPVNYYYENICNSQPSILELNKIYFQRISNKIEAFIADVDKPCEFWLSYKTSNKKNASYDQIKLFIEKLSKKEINTKKQDKILPILNDFYTKKMIQFLIMKPSYVYQWFLNGKVTKNIFEFNEIINKTYIELNEMKIKSKSDELNENEENEDFDLLNISDFLSPQLEKLVKLITSQRIDSHYLLLFTKLFKKISKNAHSHQLFINYTTEYFKEISVQSIGCDSLPSLKMMHHLIDLFKIFSLHKSYKDNLYYFYCFDMIKFAMMPKWRQNSALLMKTLYLVYDYKPKITNNIIYLIGFIILNDSDDFFTIFKFYEQLQPEEKEKLNHLILFKFDQEVEKEKLNSTIINYYNKLSSILMKQRKDVLYSLLMNNIDYFTKKIDKDALNFLSSSFNFMAPKRNDLIQLTTNNDYESNYVSQLVKESSPKFWTLYEKYEEIIIDIISPKIMKLRKFNFLLEFPELVDFKLRSLYFRKKMQKRIKKENPLIFEIDRDEILESSFHKIQHLEPDSLLNQIKIQYKQELGVDTGGLLRDWFTKLIRALFNQNLSLFSCSKKSQSYQPNINSKINSNHLQYFRFTGMIIARALIEGICIDTHLTSSFYKQILHRDPDLNDLQEVDEELFQSLQSLIESDVDSLCLTFTSSDDDFGTCKIVPLKENGDEIDVKNENKEEFIRLLTNYKLKTSIEEQLKEFCIGFDSLISNQDIKMFKPNEIDLLMCGISSINVEDFKNNTEFIDPYNAETPVVKLFFETISKWNNEQLRLLLLFMTGSSRVPANGFKEFCEMSGQTLKIAPGGDKNLLPVARTCFNRIDLPHYETEKELNEKLLFAINNCNSFNIR